MDDIAENIKAYALVIEEDLESQSDLLELIIDSVIDRFLIYTNRQQLDEEEQVPEVLERTLAMISVKIMQGLLNDSKFAITGASDNGQSVNFSNEVVSYMSSIEDRKVFEGVTELLNKFRLATVVTDEIT